MDQRQAVFMAAAAAVALLGIYVALSGTPAPAAPGDDPVPGAIPTATSVPSPTPGGGTPTITPAPSPTPSGRQYYRFDGGRFNETHFGRLARAGSFTSQSNLTVVGPSAHSHYNVTYIVDLEAETQYSAIDFRDLRRDGDTYPLVRKFERGDSVHINRTQTDRQPDCTDYHAPYEDEDEDRPVNTTLALDVGEIATGVIGRSNWTYAGNRTAGGVTLYRFDVRETRNFGARVAGTVTDGSASMVVGSDGILRFVEYDFRVRRNGETTRYVYRSVFTNVGSTRVAQPAWYPC